MKLTKRIRLQLYKEAFILLQDDINKEDFIVGMCFYINEVIKTQFDDKIDSPYKNLQKYPEIIEVSVIKEEFRGLKSHFFSLDKAGHKLRTEVLTEAIEKLGRELKLK